MTFPPEPPDPVDQWLAGLETQAAKDIVREMCYGSEGLVGGYDCEIDYAQLRRRLLDVERQAKGAA